MKTIKNESIRIAGIAVKTQNIPGKAEIDIPALWGKFMQENISEQLAKKTSEDIYCVYCEYEGDHSMPYTTLIGYAVPQGTEIPKNMQTLDIDASNYAVFNAEGDLTGGAVFEAWNTIWKSELDRTYKADFEVYGKDATNPKDGKIDIFVSIN